MADAERPNGVNPLHELQAISIVLVTWPAPDNVAMYAAILREDVLPFCPVGTGSDALVAAAQDWLAGGDQRTDALRTAVHDLYRRRAATLSAQRKGDTV